MHFFLWPNLPFWCFSPVPRSFRHAQQRLNVKNVKQQTCALVSLRTLKSEWITLSGKYRNHASYFFYRNKNVYVLPCNVTIAHVHIAMSILKWCIVKPYNKLLYTIYHDNLKNICWWMNWFRHLGSVNQHSSSFLFSLFALTKTGEGRHYKVVIN